MSEEKPRFIRGQKKKEQADEPTPPPNYGSKPEKQVDARSQKTVQMDTLLKEKQRLDDQLLMTEWALTGGRFQVYTWLQEVKGFSAAHARNIVNRRPLPQWNRILDYVQNSYSNNLVKRHMESAAQANDQHLMAAKLGMAKAMEFLSKLKVEEALDQHGQPYFKKFRTTDLKNCMEAIQIAQKITRVALGLPTDEGSVHIWKTIQQSFTGAMPEDKPEGEVAAGPDIGDQVRQLQKAYSYDEIKAMMEAFKQAGMTGDTIDVETAK